MFAMATPWKHPKTGIYHIRITIPKALKGCFGKTEYKRPLVDPVTKEQARTEAADKRLWPPYYAEWEAHKAKALVWEAGQASSDEAEWTDELIHAVCAQWLERELDEFKNLPEDDEHVQLIWQLGSEFLSDLDERPERSPKALLHSFPKLAEWAVETAKGVGMPLGCSHL